MRPVSNNFLSTIRGAHKAVFRATVCSYGQLGVTPTGTRINIIDGDVIFDTGSDVNATLDLLTDMSWPYTSSALGAPYGQEVFVERGVQYSNGTQEWVGLGYFRIDRVEQTNAPKGLIRISGSDRMANIRDSRPLQPTPFIAGTSVQDTINNTIWGGYPYATVIYDFDATAVSLGADHVLDDDRIKFLNEILTAYGKIGYFDYAGRFQVKSPPSTTSAPVYTIDAGRNGVLCTMSRTISRDGVYNAVVATGEPVGDQPPVRGQALDTNVFSPTFYNGPFGLVPRFFSSSFLQTSAQCDSAAASILAQSTGIPYNVDLGIVPNPALEGWDVINVKYDDKLTPEVHVIDKIQYNLGVSDAMTISTRKQLLT